MLLNKYNFLPRKFAGTKGLHEATKGILIDPARGITAATDRYTLLEVHAPKMALAEDFPIIPGYKISPDEDKAAHIMPADAAKEIEKNLKAIKKQSLPILYNAAPLIIEQDNAAGMATTTLDKAQPVIYQKIDDKFPDYCQIIPADDKEPRAVVHLSPELLERMAAAYKAAGVGSVEVRIYEDTEPVRFSAIGGEDQSIIGLIMPIKA